MNLRKLERLVKDSEMTKTQIAKKCGITRVTLENALQGGDIRVSILESIARVLQTPIGYLFDEEAEHYEAHGKHGIVAKNIQKIDNRDMVQVKNGDGVTEVEEISEEIVLPPDCPEQAKHIVDKLSIEVSFLKRLLESTEKRIAEKDERIEELKGRIEELKAK